MVGVRRRMLVLTASLALTALTTAVAPAALVGAQDATPAGSMAGMGMSAVGMPNHLHNGSCDNLGDVVFPLTDLVEPSAAPASGDTMATPMASAMTAAGIPVRAASTRVSMPLSEIISGGHAIQIHKSAEEITFYIACGDIAGTPTKDGDLFIGLKEQNNSGDSGVAWFHPDGADTIVTIMLAEYGK